MTTNYHDPWVDGVTEYKASNMNTPLGQLDSQIATNTSDILTHTHKLDYSSGPYDIGGTYDGKPSAGQVLLRYPLPREVTFLIGMGESQMIADVAATAESVFSVKKNDVEFATITFAIAGTVASMTCAIETDFVAGDILTLVAPNPQDATLEDLGWGLAAIRNSELATTTSTSSSTTSSSTTNSSTSSTTTSSTTTSSTTTSSTSSTASTSSSTTSTSSSTSSTTTTVVP